MFIRWGIQSVSALGFNSIFIATLDSSSSSSSSFNFICIQCFLCLLRTTFCQHFRSSADCVALLSIPRSHSQSLSHSHSHSHFCLAFSRTLCFDEFPRLTHTQTHTHTQEAHLAFGGSFRSCKLFNILGVYKITKRVSLSFSGPPPMRPRLPCPARLSAWAIRAAVKT